MGWFIGQTLELTIAGAVVGSGLAGMRLWRLFGVVIIFCLAVSNYDNYLTVFGSGSHNKHIMSAAQPRHPPDVANAASIRSDS
jgi:hypothetical protein